MIKEWGGVVGGRGRRMTGSRRKGAEKRGRSLARSEQPSRRLWGKRTDNTYIHTYSVAKVDYRERTAPKIPYIVHQYYFFIYENWFRVYGSFIFNF